MNNLEKWCVLVFPAIRIPYLDVESLYIHDCGSIVQDLLVSHGYLESAQEKFQQIEPDDDEIMEVNVGNEEIRDEIFSDGGGWFRNMFYVLDLLLGSTGYVLPHSVEQVFDTIRQLTTDNNNYYETNWRCTKLEEQLGAVKWRNGIWKVEQRLQLVTKCGILKQLDC